MHQESLNIILSEINLSKLKKSKIKNILITGCSGFIGNYLINTLLNKRIKNNFNIYGVDIIKPKFEKNIKKEKFTFIKKNLFNITNFTLKKKIDLTIHLAGIPSPSFYKKKPLQTFYLNCELSRIFLEFSKLNRSRFIYFSSSEIYGNPDKKNIPTKESYEGRVSSVGDRSCYDESKRAGETYTWIYRNLYKMNCSIIRPFNFYGNGMKKNDKRAIPQFFNTALNKKKIMPFSNGKQTRTYCHIIDAIPQIINICFYGKKIIYNVGNPKNEISALNLAKKIKKIINNNTIKIKRIPYPKSYPSNEPLRRCPDIQNLKKEFNYKPKISLAHGLKLFKDYSINNFI